MRGQLTTLMFTPLLGELIPSLQSSEGVSINIATMNNKWFVSSTGSGDLSLTIKGLLTALIPLIIIAASFLGYQITDADVQVWIVAVTSFISTALTLYGLIRKLYNAFKTKNTEVVEIDSLPDTRP